MQKSLRRNPQSLWYSLRWCFLWLNGIRWKIHFTPDHVTLGTSIHHVAWSHVTLGTSMHHIAWSHATLGTVLVDHIFAIGVTCIPPEHHKILKTHGILIPVHSTVTIPARQPRRDTSTRNRRSILQTSESHNWHPESDSETTTSESSVSLPSSPLTGSSCSEGTSTSGTDSSLSETSSNGSSSQPSSNTLSLGTTTSASLSQTTSPELQEMEHSFNTLLVWDRNRGMQ